MYKERKGIFIFIKSNSTKLQPSLCLCQHGDPIPIDGIR